MGIKISVKKDENEYNKVLEQAQKDNERLGYGNRKRISKKGSESKTRSVSKRTQSKYC